MRHDLIAELCHSIIRLDQAGGVASVLPRGTLSGYAQLPGANNDKTLSVYGNVEVKRLVADGPGVHFEVSRPCTLTSISCLQRLCHSSHAAHKQHLKWIRMIAEWREEYDLLEGAILSPVAVAIWSCCTLQVAFDDLPLNAKSTTRQKQMFWETSRRLQQGNLVVLWQDSRPSQAAAPQQARQPCLTFATVSQRDEMKLARHARPVISIRYLLQFALAHWF